MTNNLRLALLALLLALPATTAPAADPATTRDLVAALFGGDEDARMDAIDALGRSSDPRATAPLLDLLADPRRPGLERIAAATALGQRGDRRAVEPMIAALRDDMRRRTGVMMAIIPSLGALADRRAVPVLLEALNRREDHWLAREVAARALGRIGDTRAVPALLTAVWMADTRTAAVAALAGFRDPRALGVLLPALQSGDEPEVRHSAAVGLIFLGTEAVPALTELAVRDGGEAYDQSLRLRAIEILGAIGGEPARAALNRAAQAKGAVVRMAARAALRRFDDD